MCIRDSAYTPHSWFRFDIDDTLPQLVVTDAVFIDGYSQSGASENTLAIGDDANLRIEFTSTAADNKLGFFFSGNSGGSTLQGVAINEFGSHGVVVDGGVDDVTIRGNFIGTDVSGTLDAGNGGIGVFTRSNNTLIGGSDDGDRNIISGNQDHGVLFFHDTVLTGNVIENNYVGVDATGLVDIGNAGFGVQAAVDFDGLQIIDNVVSGNQADGIRIDGNQVNDATVQGNLVGVSADGVSGIGNDGSGFRIVSQSATGIQIGGTAAGEGNVIGANGFAGISVDGLSASGTVIQGNFIGTDVSATIDLGNGADGIFLALSLIHI